MRTAFSIMGVVGVVIVVVGVWRAYAPAGMVTLGGLLMLGAWGMDRIMKGTNQ